MHWWLSSAPRSWTWLPRLDREKGVLLDTWVCVGQRLNVKGSAVFSVGAQFPATQVATERVRFDREHYDTFTQMADTV